MPVLNLKGALDQDLSSPGIYLLIGDDTDGGFDEQVYVGQTERSTSASDGTNRTTVWSSGRRSWCLYQRMGSLIRAHILYIESRLLDHADIAGRVRVVSTTRPPAPALSENTRVEAEGFLSDLSS